MGGEESVAGFDHVKLRERLRWCSPLQKVYERVFFDGYDLARVCKQFDNFEDGTIARSLFKTIILRDVQGIKAAPKPRPEGMITEFHQLMQVLPRTAPAPGESKKEIRIFY